MTPTQPASHEKDRRRITPRALALRAGSFVVAWWAFTEGRWDEWTVAMVIIVLATLASLHVLPLTAWPWSLRGLIRFIPYFLRQSWLGGIDVAWRALHPRLPIHTGLEVFQTRLPAGLPSVFLAWTVSLLPGTASIRQEKDRLTVHLLNDEDFEERMRELEDHIAPIFGLDFEDRAARR